MLIWLKIADYYKTQKLITTYKDGKRNIRFGNIDIEKQKFDHYKSYFLEDIDIDNVLVSNKISSGKKTVNTLLITCMMIMKLSHYI